MSSHSYRTEKSCYTYCEHFDNSHMLSISCIQLLASLTSLYQAAPNAFN